MNIEVLPARIESLQEAASDEERSAQILKRVEQAWAMQGARYSGTVYRYNSQLHDRDVERYCALEAEERMLMKNIYEQYTYSNQEFIDNKCVVFLWRRGSHEVWN